MTAHTALHLGILDIRRIIGPNRLNYLDLARSTIQLNVACGAGFVYVIGAPDRGCFEWVAHTNVRELIYSNAGYGSTSAALRDGLIVALGEHDRSDPAHLTIGVLNAEALYRQTAPKGAQ